MLVRLPHLRQPQDYTGVNDDSPLTQGLVELVVPHWRRSSATGKPMIPGSTGGSGYRTWRAGRYGIHRHLDRANVAEDRYRIETGVTGDFTLFLLGGTDGALAATQRMLLLQTTGGTRRAAMGEEGTSKFAGETNPSGGSSVTATESTTTLGQDHLYALRLSGTAQTLWVDGVQVASATQATNNFSDVGQMSLNTTGFLSSGSGRIYLCGFAARAWTDQEMALAAANPWAMFAPRRIWVPVPATGGGTSVVPDAGALTLTGYAPSIAQPHAAAPGVGALTITGYAPSVSQPQAVTPGVGALTIAGYAPTVAQPHVVAPGAGTLALTGYAPSIAQPHAVAAGVGSLTITGYAPTVEQVSGIAPGTGTLTLSGYAPTVTQSEAQAVFPGAGTLAFVGYAPTISQAAGPGNIFPPAGTVTITGHAPTVAQTGAGGGYSDSTLGRKSRKKTVVLHKDDADERKAEFSALLEKVRAQGAERAEAAVLDDARRDNSPPLDPLNVRPPRMPEVRGVAPSALREWMPSLLAAYQSEYRATYADRFDALLREQQAAQARQSLIDDDEDVALLAMMF